MNDNNKSPPKMGSYAVSNEEEIVTFFKDQPQKQSIDGASTSTGNQECVTAAYCKTGLAQKRNAESLKLQLPLDSKAGKLSARTVAKGTTTWQFLAVALLFLGFAYINVTGEELLM